MSKGVRMTILGSGFFMWGFFKLFLAGPFRAGPPFGVWMFIGFVLLAYGISKLVSFRPAHISSPPVNPNPILPAQPGNPLFNQPRNSPRPARPLFSNFSTDENATPRTSELEPGRSKTPGVTEEDTQQLPRGGSTRR